MTLHAFSRLTTLTALALAALTAHAADASISTTGSLAAEQSAWQSFASGLSKEISFSWSDFKTGSGFSQGSSFQSSAQSDDGLSLLAKGKLDAQTESGKGQASASLEGSIKLSDLGLEKAESAHSLIGHFEHENEHHKPVSEVPEPSTWVMMALGLLGLAALTRRRAR